MEDIEGRLKEEIQQKKIIPGQTEALVKQYEKGWSDIDF